MSLANSRSSLYQKCMILATLDLDLGLS